MKPYLRILSVLLLLGGLPVFLDLRCLFCGVGTHGAARHTLIPATQAERFFEMYLVMAIAGLVSAAGALLWAVTTMAYPRKPKSGGVKILCKTGPLS